MLNASPTCCCRIATRERGSRPGACCRGFGRAGFGCGDGTASICFRDVLGFELSQKSSQPWRLSAKRTPARAADAFCRIASRVRALSLPLYRAAPR